MLTYNLLNSVKIFIFYDGFHIPNEIFYNFVVVF